MSIAKGKNYGNQFGVKLTKIAPMSTSRGCKYRCNFCTYNMIKYRERSIDNVIKEMKRIKKYGYKYILITDDNFLSNKLRVKKAMEKIIEEKIKIKLMVQGRCDSTDYDLYALMKKAGVFVVAFGIESANQDILDYYNKKIKIENIINAVKTADKAGLIIVGNFIIGAPMESIKHIQKNKKFYDDVPIDLISLNILTYVKGTKIWFEANKSGLIDESEIFLLTNDKLSKYAYDDLCEIQNNMTKYFYKNKKRLIRIIIKLIKYNEIKIIYLVCKSFLSKKAYTPPEQRHGFQVTKVVLPQSE